MSLITEALRKARQEAVRQEALKSGGPAYPYLVEPTPDRGRMRTYLILGALAVLLAASLGAAGAVWLMSDRVDLDPRPARAALDPAPEAAPAAPVPVIEEVPVPEAAAPEASEAVAPEPEPEAAIQPEPRPERVVVPPPAEEPAAERLAERPIQLREPAPRPEAVEAPVSDPVLPAPAAPEASEVPQPAAAPQPSGPTQAAVAAGLENGKSYVREMPVPGGGTLKLNGIAFSENPVALFTDKVVSPGEEIQGFKVSKVEAGRVELQGHGVTVYVTVK